MGLIANLDLLLYGSELVFRRVHFHILFAGEFSFKLKNQAMLYVTIMSQMTYRLPPAPRNDHVVVDVAIDPPLFEFEFFSFFISNRKIYCIFWNSIQLYLLTPFFSTCPS